MTIDEAITYYQDVIENLEKQANYRPRFDMYDESDTREECLQSAKDYKQLIEWLKELKELRAKVTHSKWISKYDEKHGFHYICGNCNVISGARTTFCFDCGADMKKEC